jgi:hypothetical protein
VQRSANVSIGSANEPALAGGICGAVGVIL